MRAQQQEGRVDREKLCAEKVLVVPGIADVSVLLSPPPLQIGIAPLYRACLGCRLYSLQQLIECYALHW